MTYTEEQVKGIIEHNLQLKKEVAELNTKLKKAQSEKKRIEDAYNSMCRRCLEVYVSRKPFTEEVDIKVRSSVFMRDDDYRVGLVQSLTELFIQRRRRFDIPLG